MHEDVATIVYEIRRLAREFPGEPVPAQIAPVAPPSGGVDVSKAALLRLSAPQRHVLALAASGYDQGQIARLTAGSTGRTRAGLLLAMRQLGLSPRLAQAFGSAAVASRAPGRRKAGPQP